MIVESVAAGIEHSAVSFRHVPQADGAVVVHIILHVHHPHVPVSPHELDHPVVNGLHHQTTKLVIVLPPEHVDVSQCISGV